MIQGSAYLITAMFTGAEAVASYIVYMVDWVEDTMAERMDSDP
jgi:hypothetical protein